MKRSDIIHSRIAHTYFVLEHALLCNEIMEKGEYWLKTTCHSPNGVYIISNDF